MTTVRGWLLILVLTAHARAFHPTVPVSVPATTPTPRPSFPGLYATQDRPATPSRKRARPISVTPPSVLAARAAARSKPRVTSAANATSQQLATRKVEQERQLSETIQRSRELGKLREALATELGRPPTGREWASQAGLEPNQLVLHMVAGRRARERLVSMNRGLVPWLAKRYSRFLPAGSDSDLVQDGNIGLIRAAELFDPSKGAQFSTYATRRIRAHMMMHVRDTGPIHVPRPLSQLADKIRKLQSEADTLGKTITDDELAELLEVPKKRVLAAKAASGRSFVDFNPSGDFDYSMEEQVTSSSSEQMSKVDHLLMLGDVQDAMAATLSSKELQVIQVRFGLTDGVFRSQREAAALLGVSKETVRQTCLRGFKKVMETETGRALSAYMCD